MVEASARNDRGHAASGAPKKTGRNPTSSTASQSPPLTKLVTRERELAGLYRLVLAKVHLPYGRDALEASAMSHDLRAARIEKHAAERAGRTQRSKAHAPGSTPTSVASTGGPEHRDANPRVTVSSLLQRLADALGPHAALASLETAERRLLRAYERLDVDSLPPATRLFVERELYPEEARTLDTARAVKDSYA